MPIQVAYLVIIEGIKIVVKLAAGRVRKILVIADCVIDLSMKDFTNLPAEVPVCCIRFIASREEARTIYVLLQVFDQRERALLVNRPVLVCYEDEYISVCSNICGLGPTKLISPLRMLNSSGSSSIDVERKNLPNFVRRFSSGNNFPFLSFALVMVRNL